MFVAAGERVLGLLGNDRCVAHVPGEIIKIYGLVAQLLSVELRRRSCWSKTILLRRQSLIYSRPVYELWTRASNKHPRSSDIIVPIELAEGLAGPRDAAASGVSAA
jgi:hypothetical protein